MKKFFSLIVAQLFLSIAYTQTVGIGTTTPDASAQLDVSSTSKGLLPPRMTAAQRDAITSPVAGLMVWCTDCGPSGGLSIFNGTTWSLIIGLVTPTVTTTPISNINSTSASSGGNVVADGGATVTARGVCWGTTINPTIAGNLTINGSGTGSFTSSITGLTLGTTYYVRAYATNIVGTSYGDNISFTVVLGIGDAYEGGKIAYILQPGDPGYIAGQTHGLIAATSDQSGGAQWGCTGLAIPGADGTALGTGNQNTIDIMTYCPTAGIASRICGDLSLNGYTDWYLPSKDELNKLYLNRVTIGGFSGTPYWSSSEVDGSNAWAQDFNSGSSFPNSKNQFFRVRAVRAF